MKKLIIDGELTDLNTYIGAMNNNRYVGNTIKKDDTNRVFYSCREQAMKGIAKPVFIVFEWYTKNKRKDPDNLSSFSRKAILDGLVMANVLKDDGQDEIIGFMDFFHIDKESPRCEINFYTDPSKIRLKDYII